MIDSSHEPNAFNSNSTTTTTITTAPTPPIRRFPLKRAPVASEQPNSPSPAQLKRWETEGWPVEFLKADPESAQLLQDNAVFLLATFFGHEWHYSPESGLSLLYRPPNDTESKFTPWSLIKPVAKYVDYNGWRIFDGLQYTADGLTHRHIWKWEKLEPIYRFPESTDGSRTRPDYCYVDIISCCWEHRGMQGFGLFGGPHGHTLVEFGDDLGNVWSVGQYPDPESKTLGAASPFTTGHAVLMSPDSYFVSRGEKSAHRYHVGTGEEGRRNIAKLKKLIEGTQSYHVTDGEVHTCALTHNAVTSNCSDFALWIENYTINRLHGTLYNLDNETAFLPLRTKITQRGYKPNARLRVSRNLPPQHRNRSASNSSSGGSNAVVVSGIRQRKLSITTKRQSQSPSDALIGSSSQRPSSDKRSNAPDNTTADEVHPADRPWYKRLAGYIYNKLVLFLIDLLMAVLYIVPGLSDRLGKGKGVDFVEYDDSLSVSNSDSQLSSCGAETSEESDQTLTPPPSPVLESPKSPGFKLVIQDVGAIKNKLFIGREINYPRRIRMQQMFSKRLRHHSAVFLT